MIQIRKATAEDFPQVLVLLRQLWPGKPMHEERVRDVYLRVIASPNREYYCAVLGPRVVGLASVTFKDNLWQEGTLAFAEEIVVHEDVRGKGIGTQLLNRLIESAREKGCRRIELDSAHHRKEAHRFYEHHGFENRACLFSKVL